MKKNEEKEFLLAVDKLQWALGETLFRARKLQDVVDGYPKMNAKYKKHIRELIKTLTEVSFLYRHKIADNIKSTFPKVL